MLDKLKQLALRYEDLQAQLADPGVYGDGEKLKAVSRELKELEPVVAALAGVLVFGEPMGAATLAGIVCVLAGVYILR